ncbi:hypothetical protein MBAV_000300 [Candidatus Magnetobacterium bavaricum]|uniref:Uncharacterized protein n=1 Tax=Candidatus Magnetobacterium bavaricum TaxID=29290 RepID=A0A0F3H042_9BACT|nr:hypothetical protein MBAV_000300 [Candidatus Magnetobacterium bavaricum]
MKNGIARGSARGLDVAVDHYLRHYWRNTRSPGQIIYELPVSPVYNPFLLHYVSFTTSSLHLPCL